MRQWHNNAATDAGIEQFTEGDCWILAWAIHQRRELPIIGLAEGTSKHSWFHVVNRPAPGIYLDVEGLHAKRQLAEVWCGEDVKMHANRLDWLEGAAPPQPSDWTFDDSVRRAYRMADRLIAKYDL